MHAVHGMPGRILEAWVDRAPGGNEGGVDRLDAPARDEAQLVFKLGIDVDSAAKILPTCSGMSDVFRQSAIAPDPFRPAWHIYNGVWTPRATGGQVDLIRKVFRNRGIDIETMFPATQSLLEESERRGFTYGTVEDPPEE